MPRLSIIQAQETPSGQLPIVRGPGENPNLSGLARGLDNIADSFGRLRDAQERRNLELQADEAKLHVVNATSEAEAHWMERLQQLREQAPAGAVGFTSSFLKEWDGYAKKIEDGAPEMAKQAMTERLAHLKSRLHAQAFQLETHARTTKLRDDYEAGTDADTRIAFADPSQAVAKIAQRVAAANTLALPADVRAALAGKARESIAYSAASALADRDPDGLLTRIGVAGRKTGKDGKPLPSDPAAAAEAVKNDPLLSSLSPEGLRSVTERATAIKVQREQLAAAEAERKARQAEMWAAKRDREASAAWNMISGYVMAGKMPDAATTKAAQSAMAGTPYAKALPGLLAEVQNRVAVAMLPLDVQQAQLDALMQRRNTQGTNPGLEEEIKRRQHGLSEAKKDYAADPLGAALERNLVQPVPIDFDRPETLAARAEQARLVSTRVGKVVGMLRPAEAEALTKWFATKASPAEKSAAVATIYRAAGRDVGMATFAQLGKDAPMLAVAAGLAGFNAKTTAGRAVSDLIFQGEELLRTKAVNIPGSDANPENAGQMLRRFQEVVGNAIPNQTARQYAAHATGMVYAKLMHEAGKFNEKNIDTSVFDQAARLVTGGAFKHGNSFILPAGYGVSAADTRKLIRSVTPAQVKSWGGVDGMTDEEAANYIATEATLESQTFGRYRVPMGAGILRNKRGEPFELVLR